MNAFATAIIGNATTTQTENGAVTYTTSLDPIVDMFFTIGAKRGYNYDAIKKVITPAFLADPVLAFRVALWVRDIKQGAGERDTFRHILRFVIENDLKGIAYRAIPKILELGRTDDLYILLEDKDLAPLVLARIQWELVENQNGLVAKWIPRKGLINSRIRNYMRMQPAAFRKLLVGLTNVVETKMCNKEWSDINYSHVPSRAMALYSKAFGRHDQDRFGSYLNRVKTGAVNPETGKAEKINTGTLYPYDVIRMDDAVAQDVIWKNLPDFVPEGISFMPIIDTSGSMSTPAGGKGSLTALDVAVSLGIYLAERNKSVFKDLWLNFSTNPSFQMLQGGTISQKVHNLDYSNWNGSTNLEAAMRLILKTAKDNNVGQADLPDYLLVLSDMEFNSWGNKDVGRGTKQLFAEAGYKAPNIIWWNIESRNDTVPVRANEQGMGLVSGFSPTIVQNLLRGEITPVNIMMSTISKDRYKF